MRTFELVDNYNRMIFYVTDTEIETHNDMFDSHEGGNLLPQKKKIITLEELRFMGMNSTEQFILKTMMREKTFREITGNYRKGILKTYEENKEKYN
jgi:hypothetical protein